MWLSRLFDAGIAEEELPSYNHLRYAWYSFLRLLDINYAAGSTCSECGPQPNIVVCDGITVAFRKTIILWVNQTTTIGNAPDSIVDFPYTKIAVDVPAASV